MVASFCCCEVEIFRSSDKETNTTAVSSIVKLVYLACVSIIFNTIERDAFMKISANENPTVVILCSLIHYEAIPFFNFWIWYAFLQNLNCGIPSLRYTVVNRKRKNSRVSSSFCRIFRGGGMCVGNGGSRDEIMSWSNHDSK